MNVVARSRGKGKAGRPPGVDGDGSVKRAEFEHAGRPWRIQAQGRELQLQERSGKDLAWVTNATGRLQRSGELLWSGCPRPLRPPAEAAARQLLGLPLPPEEPPAPPPPPAPSPAPPPAPARGGGGAAAARPAPDDQTPRCSKCKEPGHNARTCGRAAMRRGAKRAARPAARAQAPRSPTGTLLGTGPAAPPPPPTSGPGAATIVADLPDQAPQEPVQDRLLRPVRHQKPLTPEEQAQARREIAGAVARADQAVGAFIDRIPEASAEDLAGAAPAPPAARPLPDLFQRSPAPATDEGREARLLAVPALPVRQHVEVYVGPPRDARIAELERAIEYSLGRLEDLPRRLPSITATADLAALRDVIERFRFALTT